MSVSMLATRCVGGAEAVRRGCRAAAPAARRQRFAASFAGIQDVGFHSDMKFVKETTPLPVFRLIDEAGDLMPNAELPFSQEAMLDLYSTMVKVTQIDHVLNNLQRQGRISFYMTGNGEEAAQVGSAAGLHASDVIWPQYRELGVFLHRGFTIQQVVDQCMSRSSEAGKGRQMPVHYCDANLNMQAVTSPLATQIPQSVGAGYAFRISGQDRCGVSYFGDGAASEGDFAVALNFAATLKAQAIFICRNNGWAISTPVKEQYAGDGIAARAPAYGMHAIRVDGNDLAAVYAATQMARKVCVEGQEPVLIELMTYRRAHHSTSDDATRYRVGSEVKMMGREGLEPLSRVKLFLQKAGNWKEGFDEEVKEAARAEVMSALKIAEAKKFAAVKDMFTDVYAAEPPHLKQQYQELLEHIERHPGKYDLSKYEGGSV
mmetsp:Transcript_55374/g.132096  ORF Transcript_55374/g.132096 Transcript_55374/m.132096 type:complete len:431 (-) Transcript_55374:65-1357(-)|eukprot:CAMPEP_0178420260 /NCGR_PEP_ID=MMETSP0689_2-20121128/26037_1 /TAXON_ID=160604 /ORGANISM="Amphidinium massartii, Strain CS-259" /LENGTH=430 /DNA_ID=CAMNT_0020041729 /DNA_START=23 /DNA_END=1315 /DNA_ORIENTATION=+